MSYSIDTLCVHPSEEKNNNSFGSITVPIYQTATFSHPGIGVSTGFDYSRESNPTRSELEKTITALESACDTVACSSGMAAVALAFDLLDAGSHIVCSEDLYGGSVRLFEHQGISRGLSFTYVNTSDSSLVEQALREDTKALYIETPSNPTMEVTDLREMRRIADEHGLLLIVDNTFLSPYFQNPITLGADLVIHSGTKFLCGHNDTLAGFLSTGRGDLAERIRYSYKTVGCSLSPFDSFLLIRGIKTLALRMERQQASALKIADWLVYREKVTDVLYVGLPDHPGYETNLKQSRGFGSMISFHTDTGETARRLLENVRLISYAESLGGVDSLITYPMLQTHGDVPVELRERLGITDTFIRLSVGIENEADLIADLDQALG